ncbi:MAG: protein kinase, partial [Polyangiaceae bacterium]|nr:protein kinase [Polyangiaceae bacterium]
MAPPTSWRPVHPLIGRLLANRFQVASFVREGGMAQVFCGIQDEEPRHVAIKVVHPELAENPEIVARFLREAEVAAKLVHPNIVRILDVGEDGDLLYMVMELLFGEDLSAPIKQRGSFSEARAAEIVRGVCLALQHAHDNGVIHRDIKPENIMLCRQPEAPTREVVKVLDFGIAKVLDARDDVALPTEAPTSVRSVLTRVGALVGTPAYVSPEQGRAEALDHRADLYSLGVVLYELVCGRPPFEGQTPLHIVAKHVHEQPPAPSTHCAVHPGLEALMLRVLSKRPADRPQSARELATALERLLPELSAAPIERWIQSSPAAQPEWGGAAALAATIGASSLEEPESDDSSDLARTARIDLLSPLSGPEDTPRVVEPPTAQRSARDLSPEALAAMRRVLGATQAMRQTQTAVSTPRRHQVDYRPDHPLIGRVLNGRFQLASFVREGGMGQVFCGTQQAQPRNVAIKIVHPELSKDGEIVARFLREAKLAARLVHKNIVRILAVGQDKDQLYLVMELLFGDDLSAPIKQRGSFTESRAAGIMIDVCEALQHAHDQG